MKASFRTAGRARALGVWQVVPAVLTLGLLGAAVACSDRNPVAGGPPAPQPAPQTARLECTVQVRSRSFQCTNASPASGARGNLIIGGQNVYVKLASSNVQYNAATDTFSADVTLQNLMRQPIGTPDGVTAEGSLVFFASGPTVTSGSGVVTVANPDSVGTFLATGEPAFKYPGILDPFQTSAPKTWKFDVPGTVVTFSFVVYVSTALPNENRWVDVTPPHPFVAVGDSTVLTAVVRTAAGGGIISGATVTWSSLDTTVVKVGSTGVLKGIADGTTFVVASSGGKLDSVRVTVVPTTDNLPPVLTSLTFNPRALNSSGGAVVDTVTLTATDADGIGPFGVNVTFISPSQTTTESATCNRTSGTPSNGTWRCLVTFPQNVESGSWRLAQVTLEDIPGNVNSITTLDLAAAGINTYLNVVGTLDTTAPELTSFTFSPDSVDVRTNPDTVHFTLNATDDASGIQTVTVRLNSGQFVVSEFCFSAGGSVYECAIVIPRFVPSGTWTAEVELADKAGNESVFTTADLNGMGFPSTLKVVSNEDAVPPALTAFTFSPDSVVVSDVDSAFVTATLTAVDTLSGVQHIEVRFAAPTSGDTVTAVCALTSGTSNNGNYSCTALIPKGSEGGNWTVSDVTLTDNVFNTRIYNTAQLAGNGWKTTLKVVKL